MKKNEEKRTKRARKIVPILEIKVDGTPRHRVLEVLLSHAQPGSRLLVVTPNPEIVLLAQKDTELARILNNADFALPDGRGLSLAARYLKGQTLETIPGRIIAQELVRVASKRRWRVFLLGGAEGVAERAARQLVRQREATLPVLDKLDQLVQFASGPRLGPDGMPVDKRQTRREEEVIGEINKFRPHFLFVGFGAPKQEKWLARNLPRLKVGAAMTVGGTLDYWAGRVSLPPPFMQKLGLEWLWRLVLQPRRAPRIFRATVIFPLKVVWHKLTH